MNDRWLVIVNPNAGIRRAEKEWPHIERLLQDEGFLFDAFLTTAPEDAIEIARKNITLGYSKVIGVGGDGTLNEIANGIMQQKRLPSHEVTFAMITVGTGNDWGRMYNIPFDYKQAIQIIKNGKTFIQDVCFAKYTSGIKIKQRYFINMAGLGFDAEVALKVNKLKDQGKGGKFSYLLTLFTTLFKYKSRNGIVTIDKEKYPHSIFSLNVGVCQFNGGGMKQLPHAIPNSGKLAVTVVRNISKLKVVANVPRLFTGRFTKMKEVLTFTAQNVDIQSDNNLFLEVDGELIGHTPIEFSIKPQAIKVVINQWSDRSHSA